MAGAMKPGIVDRCVHHWQIAPEQGGSAGGRCKNCGQYRMFRTDCDDALPWYKTTGTLIQRRRTT